MSDQQGTANDVRDRLVDNPTLQRLGIEVLWTAGTPDSLVVRARHRDRVLTIERSGEWFKQPARELAAELAHELTGEALGNRRAGTPPAPRRRPESLSDPKTAS
jgi:hypothetical protein